MKKAERAERQRTVRDERHCAPATTSTSELRTERVWRRSGLGADSFERWMRHPQFHEVAVVLINESLYERQKHELYFPGVP